ncbi:sensor domain-containing diguanylate cyclase [Metapseudomonas furukawaii]|jgi:diguanylate cyclase (GGDEF)-like protein|uniref:diguanylate cyclase n=1 Tax=Metapseudomonas furukawaii TaxID=1149133 RepID=A0AAD1BZ70_METFU|nr:sensor domain-containing diguanylate cyclase [Pseudomonas furukawaii]ELS27209.1 GGDEF domain containing protein [Pseudomonas furukawaii]WAG80353.1 sensor domain-containing diguanylate cyclase [Pseudomonas furukawaii]BAU72993.1 GGDEF domain protein [Pseudomonas furukawaii]
MPLVEHSKHSQRLLVLALVLLLGGGFLATSLVSYQASLKSIRSSIVDTELPLTSDNVYSEIQKDLVRPILISSMMSRDTFVRDWVMQGEKDVGQMTRYLREIQEHYGAFTSFFVSERTLTYYQTKGVLKQVREGEPRDVWYFRLRDMKEPYEINVDVDMANQDRLTIFINYKVFDYDGRFLGATGVGLTVDAVIKLIDQYQRRYDRSVYFVDTEGRIVLTGAEGGPLGARVGTSLFDVPGLDDLKSKLSRPQIGTFEYHERGRDHFLNVRFIPELDWYLFVDKHEGGLLDGLRKTLYLNLAICVLVTLVVVQLLRRLMRRYQRRIAALATTDSLTGLPNRRGFELLAGQALQEARRDRRPLAALLLDLDHFKQLNDTYGHQAGDLVLQGFAQDLRDSLRQSDIICRWGGEEFIILLKDTGSATALQLAEKVRNDVAARRYPFKGVNLQVTTSVGLAEMHPEDALDSLIGRADRGLYRAKLSGRNCVCVEPSGNHDAL